MGRQEAPTYQRKHCVCVGGSGAEMGRFGGGGSVAEMGRRYQSIKENSVCVCWGGGGESGAEMGRRYQLTKENNVCVCWGVWGGVGVCVGGKGGLGSGVWGLRWAEGTNLSKKTICVCVCVGCVCAGQGLRWAGGTNLSKKTMCGGGEGVAEMGRRYQLIKENVCVCWGVGVGRWLRWAGGTNLTKKTMCVCVGGWGGGVRAEMGRRYQPIKENNVCVCVVGG